MNSEKARELFSYADGFLYWRNPEGNMKKGRLGSLNHKGYVRVCVSGRFFFAHRIIWMMHNHDIPQEKQIDHINRVKADNRIENLRLVTPSQNIANRDIDEAGFHWDKAYQKWRVQIRVTGVKKIKCVGRYNNRIDARAAYLAAKRGDWDSANIIGRA